MIGGPFNCGGKLFEFPSPLEQCKLLQMEASPYQSVNLSRAKFAWHSGFSPRNHVCEFAFPGRSGQVGSGRFRLCFRWKAIQHLGEWIDADHLACILPLVVNNHLAPVQCRITRSSSTQRAPHLGQELTLPTPHLWLLLPTLVRAEEAIKLPV